MPWSILHRYVLWELLRVFTLALLAITGILVMAGIVAQAAQEGLGPREIISLVPLMVPATMPFVVPATTLFAVAVVFGRLAADNEITAIKSAGVPVGYVIWPVLLASVLVSGAVFYASRTVIPQSLHRFRSTALKNVEELIYARLRRDLSFNEPKVDYSIHVKEVDGRRLLWATFKKRDAKGQDELIAQAREAELRVDMEQGVINVYMLHGDMSKNHGENTYSFDREEFAVELPPFGAARQIRGREMTNQQIAVRRAHLVVNVSELEEAVREEALNQGQAKKAKPRGDKKPDGIDRLAERLPLPVRLQLARREILELDTEVASRPALSFGSFFFAMIGCPVAVWFHRRDYLSSFVTCFLPIVVTYYPLVMFGVNLGKEGRLDPNLGMWVSNLVLGVVGAVLLLRLLRR